MAPIFDRGERQGRVITHHGRRYRLAEWPLAGGAGAMVGRIVTPIISSCTMAPAAPGRRRAILADAALDMAR